MHDAKGRELKVGDRVMLPMVVTALGTSVDYCNVSVRSVASMPGNDSHTELGAVNTKQLLRANDGDELEFTIVQDGAATRIE